MAQSSKVLSQIRNLPSLIGLHQQLVSNAAAPKGVSGDGGTLYTSDHDREFRHWSEFPVGPQVLSPDTSYQFVDQQGS